MKGFENSYFTPSSSDGCPWSKKGILLFEQWNSGIFLRSTTNKKNPLGVLLEWHNIRQYSGGITNGNFCKCTSSTELATCISGKFHYGGISGIMCWYSQNMPRKIPPYVIRDNKILFQGREVWEDGEILPSTNLTRKFN